MKTTYYSEKKQLKLLKKYIRLGNWLRFKNFISKIIGG